MSAFTKSRQRIAFAPDGVTSAPSASTASGAQSAVTGGQDSISQKYDDIFNKEMSKQADLYAKITQDNDNKNEQSSKLSLAKSVSEMV
jgi:hypothetical protein